MCDNLTTDSTAKNKSTTTYKNIVPETATRSQSVPYDIFFRINCKIIWYLIQDRYVPTLWNILITIKK